MTFHTVDNIHIKFAQQNDISTEIAFWRKSGDIQNLEKIQIWSYFRIKKFFSAKYINGKIQKPSDVESLIESAYLKFYQNHEKVRRPESFAHWLQVLCRNEMAEFYKVKKHTSEILVEDPEQCEAGYADDICCDFEKAEDINELFNIIRQILNRAEADVMYKKIIENKTNTEIALELCIQEQSVKNHYSRGIIKLRNSKIIRNMLKKKINSFY